MSLNEGVVVVDIIVVVTKDTILRSPPDSLDGVVEILVSSQRSSLALPLPEPDSISEAFIIMSPTERSLKESYAKQGINYYSLPLSHVVALVYFCGKFLFIKTPLISKTEE